MDTVNSYKPPPKKREQQTVPETHKLYELLMQSHDKGNAEPHQHDCDGTACRRTGWLQTIYSIQAQIYRSSSVTSLQRRVFSTSGTFITTSQTLRRHVKSSNHCLIAQRVQYCWIEAYFLTTIGVCQGCTLLSVLFNIFLEDIMRESHDFQTSISIGVRLICNPSFADDKDLFEAFTKNCKTSTTD